MAFSGSIPHLVNGVSRQVDAMRLPTHVEEQINRFSTPSGGNQRRPAMDHIATLPDPFAGEFFYHPINRDANERYHVLISNGDLKVYTSAGVAKTVSFPDGKTYLNATSPKSMFAAATSADYTFIVNKTKTVALDSSVKSPARGSEALIFCRAANYSRQYKVFINGSVVADYSTADGSDADRADQRREESTVTPVNLAKIFISGASTSGTINGWDVAAIGGGVGSASFSGNGDAGEATVSERLVDNLSPTDWEMKRYANVIWLKRKDGTAFSMSVECDRSSDKDSVIAIKDTIQDFSDLPNHGPVGYVCRVAGNPTDGFDDYWVVLSKPDNADTNDSVVWKECPKPNISIAYDATTMPHVLVRNSDGTFTFKKAAWVNRKVGDVLDDPSFIGAKINDVVFNRARMGFLCNESIVMTRPGEFFDFWRTTMTAVLDDDPIDVSGTSDNVAIFKYAASFAEDLYLFADQSIHRLTAGDLLTPSNVALPVAATAQVNVSVPPVPTTKSILFMGSSQAYGDVREIFTSPDTDESINSSISDHCPGYLPRSIERIVASDSVNMAFCSSSTSDTAYIYQYFWSGNEKLQAAWHKWTMPLGMTVLGSTFFDDELHLALRTDGDYIVLMRMNCAANLYDLGKDWQIKLDGRKLSTDLTPVVDGENTTFAIPFESADVKVYRWGGDAHGLPATVVEADGTSVTVPTSELPVVFGIPFTSYLEMGRIYMRQARGDREVITQSSPLRLARLWFHVDKTCELAAFVVPYVDGPVYPSTWTPLRSNDAAFDPNKIIIGRGRHSVPVKGRSDRVKVYIKTESHLPDSITGVEWEGDYDIRARRA